MHRLERKQIHTKEMRNRKHAQRSTLRPALVIGLMCMIVLGTCGWAGQAHQPAKAKAIAKPVARDAAVPFNAGERLSFRVIWSKFSVQAATIQLSVVERRDFFGRMAWHFRAMAQTINTMHAVFPLDDQLDSYTDAVRLNSLQYEMYLHEQGKQETNSWRLISDGSPAPANIAAARVAPGTRDPIDFLYVLRAADWKSTPELRVPVFDGHNLYEVVAHLESQSDQATVPAGQFTTSKIGVSVFEHGRELAGTHFTVWLAQDSTRTPVLVESELPIGTARLEMTARN